MDNILNRRPVVFVTVALMLGIFLGGLAADSLIMTIIIPIALSVVGILFVVGLKKPLICAMYIAVAFGMTIYNIDLATVNPMPDGAYLIEARVAETDSKIIFDDLKFDGKRVRGKATIDISYPLEIGDVVVFYATSSAYDNTDIFNIRDMVRYNDRVYYKLDGETELYVVGSKIKFFEKIRRRMTVAMPKFMDEEDEGIAVALLFGDKSKITHADSDIMRGVGMSHVFAVSGLHVGFLTAILIFILKKLHATPKVTLAVTSVVLILYGFLTGFPAGIKRAVIMSIIHLAAVVFVRKSDGLTSLAASCAIILVTNPRELFDLSFLMSVSAVFGILLFYRPIYRMLRGKSGNSVVKYLAGGAAVTLSANVFLLPIFANVFNAVAVYSVVSNLVIMPLITVAYAMLAVASVFNLISPAMGFLYYLAQFPIVAVRLIATGIYTLPYATIAVGKTGAAVACYVAGASVLSPIIKLPKKAKLPLLMLFVLLAIILILLV